MNYYNFYEKALNTFSPDRAKEYQNDNCTIESIISVQTFPLLHVLEEYLPDQTNIDFISIDVEGFESEVLYSNDWSIFKPTVVVIEMLNLPFEEVIKNKNFKFLESLGYIFIAKTINTCFFMLKNESYILI